MSANTSITEGGKARPFGPVKALMVQGEDGKYYPWFPESDRALGTLSVDKNGIYRASDKGVYGWSSVSVNVSQNEGVTGRDPDTGEEVYVHPNPEGELVKDVLSVEIRVTTPPTKTTYADGETIDYSGIVVHAYSATGQNMGEVPFDELVFSVTTAKKEEHGGDSFFTAESDLNTGINQPINFVKRADGYDSYFTAGGIADLYNRQNIVLASPSQPAGKLYSSDGTIITEYEGTQYTHEGKTVYFVGASSSTELDLPSNTWIKPNVAPSAQKAAWTIIYGNINAPESEQTIPVQWLRTPDGAVLETTFDITVGPHGETGDD